MNRSSAIKKPELLTTLKFVFIVTLALRFFLPFFHSPFDHLVSDSLTHWNAGKSLPYPNLFTGTFPKVFKVYIYLLRTLTDDNQPFIVFVTGLLCASMPWLWYKAIREIYSRNLAYFIAILIAICPSLSVIYGYFMTETVMLNMLALSSWMSLRALRKQTDGAFCIAYFCWLVAILSRPAALIPAVVFTFFLFVHHKNKLRLILASILISMLLLLPAMDDTYRGTQIFHPVLVDIPAKVYKYSGALSYGFYIKNGTGWSFSSGNFYVNPFDPIADFKTYRTGEKRIEIDPYKGREDWDKGIAHLKESYTSNMRWNDMKENFIFLFFGQSWPDSGKNSDYLPKRINYHFRWLMFPMLCVLLFLAPFAKLNSKEWLIIGASYLMTISLIIQQVAVLEGRYRKPLEPFLIIAIAMIIKNLRNKNKEGRMSVMSFLKDIVLAPTLKMIKFKR